jgi:hypothetical protein
VRNDAGADSIQLLWVWPQSTGVQLRYVQGMEENELSYQRDSIKRAARDAGLKIRTLEWEPIGVCLEMQGPSGGWFVETTNKDPEGEDPEFVAYSATEVCQMIRNWKKHGCELTDRDMRGVLRVRREIMRYRTKLTPKQETAFQSWLIAESIPYHDRGFADYDMRGFYKAAMAGDPRAKRAANGHFPDIWKTPHHRTFSSESIYATADAPRWNGLLLVAKDGTIVADERPCK